MKTGKVRSIAIAVILHEDRILVNIGYDSVKRQTFARPLGGTIEFGEYGHEAVERELQEEIGAQLVDLRYWGTLENIFAYNGTPGHEIILVYGANLADEDLYQQDHIRGIEGIHPMDVRWLPLEKTRYGEIMLYPTGLLEMIETMRRGA